MTFYVISPGGSVLANLNGETEDEAWANLIDDCDGLYATKAEARERGYDVWSDED